jgi:hypothetical protein
MPTSRNSDADMEMLGVLKFAAACDVCPPIWGISVDPEFYQFQNKEYHSQQ